MSYDFPSSPTNGQTVTNGSATYSYNSANKAWQQGASTAVVTSFNTRTGAVALSSGDVTTALTYTPYNSTNPSGYQTAAQVTTALAPYAPLVAPVFTGDARAVTAAYADNDTSIATTAFVQTAVAPYANNVGRNLLHNSMFNVQQRGAGNWTTGGYTADRWQLLVAGSDTNTVGLSALSDTARAQIGDEAARYCWGCTVTGAANGLSYVVQKIEGARRLSGKSVIISFWASGPAGFKFSINCYLNPGTGGSPSGGGWATGQVVTIATTWQRYSVTLTLPSLSGAVLGTNGDDHTQFGVAYSNGSANVAFPGVGLQSGAFQIWGIQLEIAQPGQTQPTPLEKLDPRNDLANCQRFYQVGSMSMTAYQVAGSGFGYHLLLPVPMRATPTVTSNMTTQTNCSGSAINSTDNISVHLYGGNATASNPVVAVGTFTASADL